MEETQPKEERGKVTLSPETDGLQHAGEAALAWDL